jgi:hypothetical protein
VVAEGSSTPHPVINETPTQSANKNVERKRGETVVLTIRHPKLVTFVTGSKAEHSRKVSEIRSLVSALGSAVTGQGEKRVSA